MFKDTIIILSVWGSGLKICKKILHKNNLEHLESYISNILNISMSLKFYGFIVPQNTPYQGSELSHF